MKKKELKKELLEQYARYQDLLNNYLILQYKVVSHELTQLNKATLQGIKGLKDNSELSDKHENLEINYPILESTPLLFNMLKGIKGLKNV